LCEPAALLLAASMPLAGRLHEGWKIPAGQDTAAIAAACYRVSHMGRHVTGLVKGSDVTMCLCQALQISKLRVIPYFGSLPRFSASSAPDVSFGEKFLAGGSENSIYCMFPKGEHSGVVILAASALSECANGLLRGVMRACGFGVKKAAKLSSALASVGSSSLNEIFFFF